MKSVYIALTFTLLAAVMPHSSDAQLLKNLVNNMTKNIGNKGTTTSGTPDSSKKSLMGYDSASMAQLMANANRANNKPKISPADSAAAIKSFMTGTGGSGIGYQYSISYTIARKNGKDSTMKDTMQLAVTDGHNTRTDMGVLGSKFAVIGHAGSPRYSVMLYSSSKTFQFNIIDTAAINSAGGMNYTAIKIGNETVQGYSCIHSRLTSKTTMGSKTTIVQDIWTSTDVPGYSTLKKMISMQNVTPRMMQALDAAGAGGMFVKMTMTTKEMSMDMVLVSAGRKSFPDSMFEIPSGYTQASPMGMFTNMMMQQKPTH
jgi:hypothetical protein